MPDTANKHFTTDRYLERLEAERILCTIFLMNGFQMHSVYNEPRISDKKEVASKLTGG